MANQIIDFEDLKNQITDTKPNTSLFNFENTFRNFLDTSKVEKISRIRDVELDKICQMLFFGVRHTAFLNVSKQSTINYLNLSANQKGKIKDIETNLYKKLEISYLLEYTIMNLSLRLSLSSQSREELKGVVNSLIKAEMEKMLNTKPETLKENLTK